VAATLVDPELDVKSLDQDEGFVNAFACMLRGLSRTAYLRKMAWLMPRISRAVPYLGYVLVAGIKPMT
jgi:hypothetical protein